VLEIAYLRPSGNQTARMEVSLEELATAIQEKISEQGYYLLYNGPLQLVWEGDVRLGAPARKIRLQKFARLHGWSVKMDDRGNSAVFKNSR
jgi:hypothetical protein